MTLSVDCYKEGGVSVGTGTSVGGGGAVSVGGGGTSVGILVGWSGFSRAVGSTVGVAEGGTARKVKG